MFKVGDKVIIIGLDKTKTCCSLNREMKQWYEKKVVLTVIKIGIKNILIEKDGYSGRAWFCKDDLLCLPKTEYLLERKFL